MNLKNNSKQYIRVPKELLYVSEDTIINSLRLLENIIDKNYDIYDYNNTYAKVDTSEFIELITKQEDTLIDLEQYYYELTNQHFITKRQKSIYHFNQKLPYLRKISYNQISEISSPSYIFIFMDNALYDEQSIISLYKDYNKSGHFKIIHNFNKNNLLSKLKPLNIGQWQKKYSKNLDTFISPTITRWILTFEFIKGGKYQKISYDGNSSWPYNFNNFCKIMHIEN